jgi:hypothetical protein
MVLDRISRLSHGVRFRFSVVRFGLIAAVAACANAGAFAGQPLVLDTQKGISDGQPGWVLQNAPLSHEPMVQTARPAGEMADSSQPYVVAPYVEVPAGGRPTPSPQPPRPPHHRPPQTQPLPAQ